MWFCLSRWTSFCKHVKKFMLNIWKRFSYLAQNLSFLYFVVYWYFKLTWKSHICLVGQAILSSLQQFLFCFYWLRVWCLCHYFSLFYSHNQILSIAVHNNAKNHQLLNNVTISSVVWQNSLLMVIIFSYSCGNSKHPKPQYFTTQVLKLSFFYLFQTQCFGTLHSILKPLSSTMIEALQRRKQSVGTAIKNFYCREHGRRFALP